MPNGPDGEPRSPPGACHSSRVGAGARGRHPRAPGSAPGRGGPEGRTAGRVRDGKPVARSCGDGWGLTARAGRAGGVPERLRVANGVRGDGAGTAVHRTSPGLDRVRPCRRSSPRTRSSTRRTASRHGPSGSMPTTRSPTPAMRDAAGTVTSVPAPGRKKEAPPDHSDDVTGPRAGSGHGVRIRPPVGQGRDGADPVPNGGSDPNGVAGGGSGTGATSEGPAKCRGSQEL